ncbi:hypothetical protein M193_gp100 [Halorubrum tailed phage 7]|uniref:hypothetical protein n=1 Tax=Halorubrum tailed phage 7 TaxID=2847108 RepID=UPI00033483C9|nr:hypothetical protein M193_gp100 [Halorubrum tailed phage 7]AGM10945.1 hypothetical protein HRTV7_74 [Halorubrum tailed phage 7]UBF22225.1 hypothetical protein HRTV-2_gp77 [Halorubrum virus HRTV-2]
MIGTIEGTATFKHVSVYREGDMVRVLGTYVDDDTTLYEAPPDSVHVGGLKMTVGNEEAVTFVPTDDEWVWVTSTGEELHITQEEPEDAGD